LDLAERAASVEAHGRPVVALSMVHAGPIKAAGAGVITPTAWWLDRRYER
jgi:hypothetical protein